MKKLSTSFFALIILIASGLVFGQSRYNLPYQRLATGSYTFFEIQNGKLFGGGFNSAGQVGNGTVSVSVNGSPASIFGFVQIGTDDDWVAVEGSASRTFALKSDGSLWGWGNNSLGYLGTGNTTSYSSPQRLPGNDWKSISTGDFHTCGIKADGSLWCFGSNNTGQVGINSISTAETTPKQVGTDNDWVQVSVGSNFALARKADGSIWGWGRNNAGQTGQGPVPTAVLTPGRIGTDNNWTHVEANYSSSLALKADGSLWAWGENSFAQLGIGVFLNPPPVYVPTRVGTDNDWVSVEIGFRQAYGIKADGSLWGWGSNTNNTLNNTGSSAVTFPSPNPLQIPGLWVDIETGAGWVAALRADGFTCAWGNNFFGNFADGTSTSLSIGNYKALRQHLCWLDVSTAGINSMALRSDGAVFTCGIGFYTGQGLPPGGTSPVFRQITLPQPAIAIYQGNGPALVLLADGSIAGYGENTSGQLGLGNTIDQNTPALIPGADRWKAIATGERYSLGIRADGSLWSWGQNYDGNLGQGLGTSNAQRAIIQTSPGRIGMDNTWVDIDASIQTSGARKADGSIWNWGNNQSGGLGIGTATGYSDSPQRMGTQNDWVSSKMFSYGLGLKANGTVWFWGSNFVGTRGNGTTGGTVTTPAQVTTLGREAIAISAGKAAHALLSDGSLKGWGGNSGAVGDGTLGFFQATPANVVFGENYPYVDGGSYGTQAITLTRDTICYTGLNSNDVAGKPNLTLTDIFLCAPVVLEESEPRLTQDISNSENAWWVDQQYKLHFSLEDRPYPFSLISMEGKILWKKTLRGEGTVDIPSAGLAPGMYLLRGGPWPAKKVMIRD